MHDRVVATEANMSEPKEQGAARRSGGGWRRLLRVPDDEYSNKGRKLNDDEREHLSRVTDELMKRYTIVHTAETAAAAATPDGAGPEPGQPVTAEELGAVLEVFYFDEDWFMRAELPEAPELEFESTATSRSVDPDGAEPAALDWSESDPDVEILGDLGSTREFLPEPVQLPAPEMGEPVAEPIAVVEETQEVRAEPEVVEPLPGPLVEEPAGPVDFLNTDSEVDEAEREVRDLESGLQSALEAERSAVEQVAEARRRLTEAREVLAMLQELESSGGRVLD
jgi:hypothetical protein